MEILAIDVKYYDKEYKICGVLFHKWEDKEPDKILTLKVHKSPNEYIPGQFYKRELPAIMEFLNHYKLHPNWLIVDGFSLLKDNNGNYKDGLGNYVQHELIENNYLTNVIGIAKSNFCKTNEVSYSIYRGNSKNPIYVQGTGYPEDIKNMYGSYRIPEMLKICDFYTKHDGEDEICNEIF